MYCCHGNHDLYICVFRSTIRNQKHRTWHRWLIDSGHAVFKSQLKVFRHRIWFHCPPLSLMFFILGSLSPAPFMGETFLCAAVVGYFHFKSVTGHADTSLSDSCSPSGSVRSNLETSLPFPPCTRVELQWLRPWSLCYFLCIRRWQMNSVALGQNIETCLQSCSNGCTFICYLSYISI